MLVGSPLGAFLLLGMLLVWLLKKVGEVGIVWVEHSAPPLGFDGGGGVDWVSGPGGGVKRVRLNRKNPAHLARHGTMGVQSRPRVWKRLTIREHPGFDHVDAKTRRMHQGGDSYAPVEDRVGTG